LPPPEHQPVLQTGSSNFSKNTMLKKPTFAPLLLLLLAMSLPCQSSLYAQERGASTAQERQAAVAMTTSLENDPLGNKAKDYRRDLLVWLAQVPDINVTLCTDILGNTKKIKGDYSSELVGQMMYSQAKFIIEHPEQAKDDQQVYLAGVEGVLRAYTAIKVAKPKVKMEPLEELLVKQQAGQLGEHVKSAMGKCKS
jgi:hypothetical protein